MVALILPKQFDETELAALDLLDETTLATLEETTLVALDETRLEELEDLMLETVAVLELDLLLTTELATLALLDETALETVAALDAVMVRIEHSLMPPATVLPAPKVASLHTKLPLNTLYVKISERP